ncbi:hypothetical protein ACLB2K_042238 [Fragaria x ananassa]
MTEFFIHKKDLDLDDPRRWLRPTDPEDQVFWDKGLVSVSGLEHLAALKKKGLKIQIPLKLSSVQEQNQSIWYRPSLPFKRKAKPLGYYPSCTMVGDTDYCHAQPSSHSAVRSCNSCGVTHWRRHCPLDRDQGAPETAPK